MLRAFFKFVVGRPRLSGLVFMSVASPLMYLGWDAGLGIRVDRLNQKIRDQGFPVFNADLNQPNIPDEKNAWHYQMQAAKIVADSQVFSPRNSTKTFPRENPYDQNWMKLAEDSEKAHEKAFELAHEATKYPQAATILKFSPSQTLMPVSENGQLNNTKNLANVLCDSAEYLHQRGDSLLALGRLKDSLCLARHVGNHPTVISSLVSTGIYALNSSSIMRIAPTLKASDLPRTREPIRQLVAELLDENQRVANAIKNNQAERINGVAQAEQPLDGILFKSAYLKLAQFKSYDHMILGDHALKARDWQPILDQIDMSGFYTPDFIPQLKKWFLPSAWIERHYRCLAETRMVALNLACQLYRMEHDNTFPKTLDQLVPDYIPAIPEDPYTAKPFLYYPDKYKTLDGADRPVLVSPSGAIDLGPVAENPNYVWELMRTNPTTWKTVRDIWQYRDLTWFKPTPLPSPYKAFNNDPDESDEAGDQQKPEEAPGEEGQD